MGRLELDAADSTSEVSSTKDVQRLAEMAVILLERDRAPKTFVVPVGARAVIGRSTVCEVRIESESVSRQHARIETASGWTIEDLGSRNGVTLRGVRIEPRLPIPLRPGDVLGIGKVVIVVQRATSGLPALEQSSRLPRDASGFAPIAVDPVTRSVFEFLEVVAPSDAPILVLGETGVGKEVVAEAIHRGSKRSSRPFLRLNCAALPEQTIEGELFGYERGAFTGAVQAKPGLFEAASGGTVFLDELGELPLTTQAKLLRVVETGEVLRLGSVKPRRVDVRFVAATNRDLEVCIAQGTFRADLFYRLNTFSVHVPPLRDRRGDILALALFYLEEASRRLGRPAPSLSHEALDCLRAHAWPGNVRELRNVMERAAVIARSSVLGAKDIHLGSGSSPSLPPHLVPGSEPHAESRRAQDPKAKSGEVPLWTRVAGEEREAIRQALEQHRGNRTHAAQALGISRGTLIARLKRYGLS